MRVLLFGNGPVALEVLRFLRRRGDEVVGLVLHPADRAACAKELEEAAGLSADAVFDAEVLDDPVVLEQIESLSPGVGLSAFFGYILRKPLLDLFGQGVVNLHPAYLPFGRGAYPNVWSIIEGTPAGATLHYVDEGVDTGDILAQQQVEVTATDTGESLYARLSAACVSLFEEAWPQFVSGELVRTPQDPKAGTSHRVRDVEAIDRIDPDRQYTAGELFDIVRARTFPPHKGAYIEVDGKRVYLRLELSDEDGK